MKRAFMGLFGMVFGGILLVPSFLIGRTFEGHSAVGGNPAILAVQSVGILLLVGAPLLFWVILPFFDRRDRKKHEL